VLAMRVAGLCLMGWVLTASGSVAGTPEFAPAFSRGLAVDQQQRLERAEIVDADTGAELRLRSKADGAILASLAWMDLEVRKAVQPKGDFHVRIAGRQDLVVIIRTGDRLRVTRGGQTAVVLLTQVDEDGLDQAQQVLAGSRAVRMFRGLQRRLTAESRESAPGVPLENLDTLLALLQGEQGAIDRRAPKREFAASRVTRASCGAERTCYSEYEIETVAAWGDFSNCCDDVKWLPGMQELCAFGWLLRAESAWFHFIGCSSIPLRGE